MMNRNRRQEVLTEKIIIIGVTGPLGSGCTTIAKFLADKKYEEIEGIQSYLQEKEYLIDGKINFDRFEIEIEGLYRRREEIDKEIVRTNRADYKSLENWQREAQKLHLELKKTLERREVIDALDALTDDGEYNKNSRQYISVSDVIILRCLVDLETEPNSKDKKEQIGRIKEIMKNNSSGPHTDFKDFYQEMKGYFSHEIKIESNYERFSNVFEKIERVKNEIVKLEFYREIMQDFGDNIRSTGNPYVYLNMISDKNERKKLIRRNIASLAKDLDYIIHYLMNSGFKLFVIDCFRNPNGARYFREKYSKFFLISLFCDHEQRLERLIAKESKRRNSIFNRGQYISEFNQWDERDKGEKLTLQEELYRQNVKQTSLISDIAINNDSINDSTKDFLFLKLIRYIGLVFDTGCTKPTSDEMFMNLAYTMAMKSNCISRQVGAVIIGEEGYVVGAGWNDVGEGQISCGLRNIRDLRLPVLKSYVKALNSTEKELAEALEKELGKKHFCFCFKDEMSARIIENDLKAILDDFFSSNVQDLGNDKENLHTGLFNKLKKDLKIKRLEYCKALHAEENAIIQGAKIGGMGIMGSTIYVTTFPCELCAKKIYQSRIREVIYTEPYPGTISKEIYLEDGVSKVNSRQFEGVKPFGYFKLFKPFPDQKEWQELNRLGLID